MAKKKYSPKTGTLTMHEKEAPKTEVPTEPTPQEEVTENYFLQRCNAIGLTPELNVLRVKKSKGNPNNKEYFEHPILCEDAKTGDVIIPVYDTAGEPMVYQNNGKAKYFEIRRYKPGNERKTAEGKLIKYDIPKGAKTLPWISPNIIEAFDTKKDIDTLVIIEGYIKAISGYLNGMHIVGLSGIQNFKDKDTGTLHPDIIKIIQERNVNNIILLYDGDCNDISLKALTDGKDLYQRPLGFYSSAVNIKELLKDFLKERHFDIYFASINTKELEGEPKGLDDLFEAFKTDSKGIYKEITSFSKQKPHYFTRINITINTRKVLDHLHITNPDVFYSAHNQIIKDKDFVFHGTKYKFDEEKKNLKVIIPGAAKFYFRVGVNYYKHIKVPNKHGVLEYRYDKWQSGVIVSDHGKNIIQFIQKYEAFCVKPDHVNYQQVIDNCFNRYRPFEHKIGESPECTETLEFIKHIFGEQYELGLDYIQILLQRPQEILPILCLVSKENNTGKSTFGKLLKAIFTGNMAMIGNADLENDFNAGWGDKLLICCEESFIDKKKTVEKIKSLSTGDKIQINQKGVDQVEIDFFGKFIFMSNNEDNFVIANEHDERFWVRRVPKAEKERTNLLDIMIEEIPNFLYFLNNRSTSTKKESRMWFAPALLRTEALRKLIEGNKSGPQKELTNILKNLFTDTGFWQLEFTLKYICETLFRNRYERNYIERLLRDNFHMKASLTAKRFKYPEIQKRTEANSTTEEKIIINSALGKPYVFTADKFLNGEEIECFELSEDAKFLGQTELAPAHIRDKAKANKQITIELEEEAADITAGDQDNLPY